MEWKSIYDIMKNRKKGIKEHKLWLKGRSLCEWFGCGPNNRETYSLGRSWIVNNNVGGKYKCNFNNDVYSFWERNGTDNVVWTSIFFSFFFPSKSFTSYTSLEIGFFFFTILLYLSYTNRNCPDLFFYFVQ